MKIDAGLYADLEFRGLIKQTTSPDLALKLSTDQMTLYCGFDPTADSLHVGSMLPLLTLKRFQRAGHKVIAVVGGATGMIGDPSFKSTERSLLSVEQLRINQAGISQVISKFLTSEGDDSTSVVIENNYNWFKGISYMEFLRDVGKHFTVNHMIAKESVRARLEDRDHGISYTEFSYMMLQAYDFYFLNKEHGCNLQIGGSDQWGNITAGTDLIRKIRAHESKNPSVELPHDTYGMTMPLVNKSDGTKFGKSESGTIWLSASRTSPYQLYQFFIQTQDNDVIPFLKYFTFLTREKILELESLTKTAPEKREAQTTLAREVLKIVHGEKELEKVEHASRALFGAEIKGLDRSTLVQIFQGAPTTKKPMSALSSPLPIIDLLVETGLCASKGAARKDVSGGGIYVNNDRISDPSATLDRSALIAGFAAVLRKGKKTYHLIEFDA